MNIELFVVFGKVNGEVVGVAEALPGKVGTGAGLLSPKLLVFVPKVEAVEVDEPKLEPPKTEPGVVLTAPPKAETVL